MKITYHAAQRFLERVIKKSNFSKYEVHRTVDYLQRVFSNIQPDTYSSKMALPGFEKSFYVVYRENAVLTIIQKNDK